MLLVACKIERDAAAHGGARELLLQRGVVRAQRGLGAGWQLLDLTRAKSRIQSARRPKSEVPAVDPRPPFHERRAQQAGLQVWNR